MNCTQASALMYKAALGELRGAASRRFHAHLSQCPTCRDEWSEVSDALELAGGYASEQPPAPLADRILTAARTEVAKTRWGRGRGWGRWAAVSAAAAAALLLAVWVKSNSAADRPGASTAGSSDWRFVLGDSGNSRRVDAATLGIPAGTLWSHRVPGLPGDYKPVAWNDVVIVGGGLDKPAYRGGGRLVAFTATTGGQRWQHDYTSGDFHKAKGFPDRCILDGRLFVTDGTQCLVLDVETGLELARFAPPANARGWGYLTASTGRLYGAGRDGRAIFCVDAATGRPLWVRSMEGRVFVPALRDGTLYTHTEEGALIALDAADGHQRWQWQADGPVGRVTVHALGERVFAVSQRDEVRAHRAADGALVWRRPAPGAFASGLAIGDEAVYTHGGLAALALGDGQVLRRAPESTSGGCSAPTVAGDRVLATAGRQEGCLSVFGASGETLGRLEDVALNACDGAIVAGGRIYVIGAGELIALAHRPAG